MAKTHWLIILVTFLISCISLALLIVSLVTPYWIVSSAKNPSATRDSDVHYGLFFGSLKKYVLSSGSDYDLTITCDYSSSACIYSCQQNADARLDELHRILNNEAIQTCPTARSLGFSPRIDLINRYAATRSSNTTTNDQFIISGYWASTVTFLIISIIFTAVAAIMSIVNVIYNPIELMLNIFGLYIWNGIAFGSMVLVLILWGSLFEASVTHNIAITDTLQSQNPYSSEGLASMGYSYWVIFASVTLSVTNIALLLLRKYLMEKQAPPPTITVERNDYTIMLY